MVVKVAAVYHMMVWGALISEVREHQISTISYCRQFVVFLADQLVFSVDVA